jgi:hypothetical protein
MENHSKYTKRSEPLTLQEALNIVARKNGCNPIRSGSSHVARCAAHDDRNASLSISQSDDGKLLMYCHAGCSFAEVCTSLDIPMHRMFAKSRERYRHGR